MVKGNKSLSEKFDRCVRKTGSFGICKAKVLKVFRTTVNSGHRHSWRVDNKFTSKNNGHKHRVIGLIAIPFRKGGHKHKIIKKVA